MYSSMPDTTARINLYSRTLRRLLGSAFLFLASLMLVASVGIAQDNGDRDCPDFNGDQQAAQDYFDSRGPGDPDRLDADGDGIACEEPGDEVDNSDQESVFDPNDEEAVSSDQYQYEDGDRQQGVQTPQTGGPALLPLAGAVMLFMSGGVLLLRRGRMG